MNAVIEADLYRYGGLTGWKGFLKGILIPGFRYTYLLRKAAMHSKYSLAGVFFRLMLRRYSFKYGFQVAVQATIGKGFYIGHFGAIVISPYARLGSNCNVAQGVTIGQTNRGRSKGTPVIGDFVWIGANAVVVGGIRIGNNVLIAPNAYVNFDVSDNAIVVGNPGKIIEREDPTAEYIEHVLP